MKLSTWLFLVALGIVMLYANIWYDHMGSVWQQFWWYDVTGVLGIVVNVICAFAIAVPIMNFAERHF